MIITNSFDCHKNIIYDCYFRWWRRLWRKWWKVLEDDFVAAV